MASSESTTTLFERVQGFVSENKRAILISATAAAVAAGGVAYYASTSSRTRAEPDVEKGGKKKKPKKKKTVKDADGPILEERVPPPKVEDEDGTFATTLFCGTRLIYLMSFQPTSCLRTSRLQACQPRYVASSLLLTCHLQPTRLGQDTKSGSVQRTRQCCLQGAPIHPSGRVLYTRHSSDTET
jgi:hypothetical protein